MVETIDTYAMDTEVAVNYSHNNAKRVIAVYSMYVDSTNFLRRVTHLLNHATTEEEFSKLAFALKKPKTQAMLNDYHQAIEDRNLYKLGSAVFQHGILKNHRLGCFFINQ